jgi:hypothetical protein
MDFTIRFPTGGPQTDQDALVGWLKERGEPCDASEVQVSLLALPVVFLWDEGTLRATLQLTPNLALSRLVDLVFAVSLHVGGDTMLEGVGPVSRPELWLLLADEQDRLRIGSALERSRQLGNSNDVMRHLWSVVHTLRRGKDDRWDAARERIVEVVEVGEEGLSVPEARRVNPDVADGDEVSLPVQGYVHTLAWRWFAETYPSIAES